MRSWQTRDSNTNFLIVVIPRSFQFCVVKHPPRNWRFLMACGAPREHLWLPAFAPSIPLGARRIWLKKLPHVCHMARFRTSDNDEWYVSEAAALDAVRRGSMFNIIHVPSGLKVDLIVASNSNFNASRFSRVRTIRIARELHATCGVSPPIASHFLPAPPPVSGSAARRLVMLRTFALIVSSFV